MPLHHLRLTAPAATIEASDLDSRTLTGVAVPYGQAGNTSAGRLTIDPGAIRVPDQLRRVKLFREHGRTAPVGFAASATDTPTALQMSFHVASTPDGDQALLEASEGVRDALSVELDNVSIEAGHVVSADLVCVAQVPVPAYAGAILTASEHSGQPDERQTTETVEVTETTTETPAADPDDPDDTEPDETETEDTMPETTETAVEGSRLTGMVPARDRRTPPNPYNDQAAFTAAAVERIAVTGARSPAEVAAALNDIVPANTGDPGGAFLRPEWLGELWSPVADTRPLSNMIGVGSLTSATFSGWKWTTKPKVASYAGNKTPIPSSPAAIDPAESGPPSRIAGGWDVDRIYVDFNTDFLSTFYAAAVASYAEESEAALATVLLAEAGAATPADDFLSGLATLAAELMGVGAAMNYVAMAGDVFAAFAGLTTAEVPWWLQNQGTISLAPASTAVAGVTVGVVPSLPDGLMIAGDRNAIDYRESGPIRVDAVNIPNGGVDLALFGYSNHITQDAAGIATVQIPVVPPVARSNGDTKSGDKRK